jgi:hypothetical protein
MPSLVVEGKLPGRSRPLFTDWLIPLPPEVERSGGRITLRALIDRVVREEVEGFRRRQGRRRFTQMISLDEIGQGVARGKVDMGGRHLRQPVDADNAVGAALQAFEDGLYLVFIDGGPANDLDEEVTVGPDARMTFVRLVALAGA